MEENLKLAVKEYQCPGCLKDCKNLSNYSQSGDSIGCGSHIAGTILGGAGKIFLGMPKGFNRLGSYNGMPLEIYETYEDGWNYNMWNIPVWKHLNKEGHTLVRGMSPRTNVQFLHVYLEDCRDKVNCMEITQGMIDGMD